MPIPLGSQLGPYEILTPLGAGGMGEVYRARDTRLDRTVAIKVLPKHLSTEPARRERFEREARAVSSLNHPHICTLHDIGAHDGIHYLVMEHIEGETLADRLKKGALPLDQALDYGSQIADALDKAHRAGIVHRDLKPGNIMLTKTGVKLLDFGLAKTREEPLAPTNDSEQPTQNKPLTDAGTILGTVQYMAPEQLEGKELDARADLFALGAVLYEMLTGRKAFEGSSQASLISAIMSTEPAPVSELQSTSPQALDRIVKKCLAKDPEDRWHSAHDLMDNVKWVAEGAESVDIRPARTRRSIALVLASLLLVGFLSWLVGRAHEPDVDLSVKRFDIALPSDERLLSGVPAVALSADGTRLAYATTGRLYLRSTDAVAAIAVPSSEDGCCPFFSPDGEWLGFFTSFELKKVSVRRGTPVSVARVINGRYGTWGPEGHIVFSRGDGAGIFRVLASGGRIEALTARTVDEFAHDWPELLPGGETILFSSRLSGAPDGNIVAQSLATGERRLLIEEGSNPRYTPTGHVVFARAGTLWAAPFDLDRLDLTGEPFPVVEGVMMLGRGAGQFNVAGEGTLIYAAGAPIWSRMVWVDREGRSQPATETLDAFNFPRISPDGTRVAVSVHPAGESHDIWVYDVDRGTRSRLTTSSHNNTPVWSPDGARIAFASQAAGSDDLYWKLVDASAEAEPLLNAENGLFPTSWHPDGSVLAYETSAAATGRDIWVLPTDGDRDPAPWLATAADEFGAAFSPNGRFVAYVSNETGQEEVYVGAYPEVGARTVISTGGGREPVWSPDGQELFYRSLDGNSVLSVTVRGGPEFSAGNTRVVFEGRYHSSPIGRTQAYDVSRDGQRFLMIQDEEADTTKLHVVLNWFEELKRLAPTE